ncbi:putative polyketide synthase [Coleophoma cylindrospora]|uniref:Putative polyketide synthase n=1 Tax=Coleophoma cylindrospora TaxID=1849047 RepID=A0A3D8STP3_9HELO|nr:putative polyketide synthase [Coleophoma cylindrospora]
MEQAPFQQKGYVQEPIAIVGLACRLPGDSNSPQALWEFLESGGIAKNEPPISRFDISTQHDGSRKPKTMRTPGGMFCENVDPKDFDAAFFGMTRTDAIAMDPQQRQLLEVVYEGLENAGITLESINGQAYSCFVGSYAVDYADMHARDPEDRPPSVTIGVGRAILSNRISHFLNIRGPSFTIDTACSGSLIAVDVACRYLNTHEINGAIVAASNLYLSPEHNMDGGAMKRAASRSGKCHTFDVKADGYCKAEATNAVILKRLNDAIRDGDPIRAIIRGSAQNSDGRTPGIASPNAEAQSRAIRAAYANAGITDLNETGYVECHGTGTQAGDPLEVTGLSNVFAATRSLDNPLYIGSIKSNVGHSEPAAGISGLLKAILSIEKGMIPGNPTFITPNPKIDFRNLKVSPSRLSRPWPAGKVKRASVNSFGYGGSNAHVIVEDPITFHIKSIRPHVSSYLLDYDDFFADNADTRPYTLLFSANDEISLKSYIKAIAKHLSNLNVNVKLPDLAYTLSERRSRHFHRAYLVTDGTEIDEAAVIFGKKWKDPPKIGFIFTGQGAQFSQMGKHLVETNPVAKSILQHLDDILQALPVPPTWSLLEELTQPRSGEHLRNPEFSQPLCTALQLAMLPILSGWGITPTSVVGHSSGEIAAACAAGLLTQEEAIKIAYFRGLSSNNCQDNTKEAVGMCAIGLGKEQVQKYIEGADEFVQIGCFNSPSSVTLSGSVACLETILNKVKADGHFARMLQVNLAYHSIFMADIAGNYEELLQQNCSAPLSGSDSISMFSSVTGKLLDHTVDADYWKKNMTSPVRFEEAAREMLSSVDGPDFLVEIGPSGALSGPVGQIKKALGSKGDKVQYCSASSRGSSAANCLYDVAGKLFIAGGAVDFSKVNEDVNDVNTKAPSIIIDLPNYVWNHSTKYWHESEASKDWRYRMFPHHDLIGTKVLGTSWTAPSWKKNLGVEDLHWLKDHRMGHEIVFPAAGFVAMAVEGLYQCRFAFHKINDTPVPNKSRYRLRNCTFSKALVLEDNGEGRKIMLTVTPCPGVKDSWHEWKVSSLIGDIWIEHSHGFITMEEDTREVAPKSVLRPLEYPTPGRLWYKAMHDAGYYFGPVFQKQIEVETLSGSQTSRSLVSLMEPEEEYTQSSYPMHPVCIDGCFQTVGPSLWKGNRSTVNAVLVPAIIDSIIINTRETRPNVGISLTSAEFVGIGRRDETKNFKSNASVYHPDTGALLFQVTGLRYSRLETQADLHATHSYCRVDWKPDVTFLNQENIRRLPANDIYSSTADPSFSKINQIIDLVAHKKPNLKIMEVTMIPGEVSSLWLDGDNFDKSVRTACREYHFASSDATVVTTAQEDYSSRGVFKFSLLDLTKPTYDVSQAGCDFDLIILKMADITQDLIANVARNARGLLTEGGYAILIEDEVSRPPTAKSDSEDSDIILVDEMSTPSDLLPTSSSILEASGFSTALKVPSDKKSVYLSIASALEPATKIEAQSPHIHFVYLSEVSDILSTFKVELLDRGWDIQEHHIKRGNNKQEHYAFYNNLKPNSIILVMDELSSPILAKVEEYQWEAIKKLASLEHRILWVTSGSQFEVTKPDNALIHGMARTMRAEDPILNLTTLDLGSSTSSDALAAVDCVLRFLENPKPKIGIENEFVERYGVIHVSRIRPDEQVNQAEKEDNEGTELGFRELHEAETCIRLRCERLGTLDSLHFAEVSDIELPLPSDFIEVEIYAAGVNFKDVAVTMGIVPENEHLPGLEGAGVIRRVGSNVDSRKVGDRVLVYEKGTFSNRVQVSVSRTFKLPDSMTFEEAATMPSVYLVAIYGLYHIAQMKRGQTVLLHSATGGVGIAAIQLCRHMGATIYATVGTDEKRKFLMDTFGIPSEHIFSSRNIEFATKIMKITDGRGVDIVLNSLTGDLLDESWRIIADGGNFIEIGKKDVLDRNNLTMEPFNRNASYRGVDMSHVSISDPLIADLISELMSLVENGHVKPISPMKVFPFEEIVEALRYLRTGTHLGKIVISNGATDAKVEVPVRPAPRQLRFKGNRSYLVIGGLKGVCGSLAIYLARTGAKNLVILSRSGYSDKRSEGVLKNIYAEGCKVDLIRGDVSVLADVRRAFDQASLPIAGLIQGAMVLRDKVYATMTTKEFHETITSKVQGTWNLHYIAKAQKEPLDFFTMLSSISGVVGQKGQANYAAANIFLDNFAAYRRSNGLAASSVDLGVIEDVGYVAENVELQTKFDGDIWTPINERLLHKILRFSLLQQGEAPINAKSSSQLITGISIPQKDTSALLRDARFTSLSSGESAGSGSSSKNDGSKEIQAFFLQLRGGAEHSAVLNACVEIVNRQFTTSLRLSEPMEPAKPLASYGLDSLAGVEFRNWCRLELGAELTTLEITNATSLFALCEKIISKIAPVASS